MPKPSFDACEGFTPQKLLVYYASTDTTSLLPVPKEHDSVQVLSRACFVHFELEERKRGESTRPLQHVCGIYSHVCACLLRGENGGEVSYTDVHIHTLVINTGAGDVL